MKTVYFKITFNPQWTSADRIRIEIAHHVYSTMALPPGEMIAQLVNLPIDQLKLKAKAEAFDNQMEGGQASENYAAGYVAGYLTALERKEVRDEII